MKYLLVLSLLFSIKISYPQNLVYNPSFEDTISCPVSAGEIHKAKYWSDPTLSTPDYFNSCNTNLYGVPNNDAGSQQSHFGFAYAGIISYFNNDKREYIQGKLLNPLVGQNKYCIEFYVSLSDNSKISISNLGLLFSKDSIAVNLSYPVLNYQANIISENFISDKENWILISGEYVAQGGESFLIIGNFSDNQNTDTLINETGSEWSAYYYIDDVSVYLCSDTLAIKIPNVFTPNNDEWNNHFLVENLPEGASVQIYNRWGVLITEWDMPNGSWDGRLKGGSEASAGVYYCIVKLPDGEIKCGFVHLIR